MAVFKFLSSPPHPHPSHCTTHDQQAMPVHDCTAQCPQPTATLHLGRSHRSPRWVARGGAPALVRCGTGWWCARWCAVRSLGPPPLPPSPPPPPRHRHRHRPPRRPVTSTSSVPLRAGLLRPSIVDPADQWSALLCVPQGAPHTAKQLLKRPGMLLLAAPAPTPPG
jgi:hypothetical protein